MTEYYAQIEDYLSGVLTGEARARFEEALQRDAGLAAEVALYQDMATALAPSKEDALRAHLAQLGKQYAPAEPAAAPVRRWWIAAVLVLLVALVGWFWQSNRQTAPPAMPVKETTPTSVDTLTNRPVVPEKPEIKEPIAGQEAIKEKPEKPQLAANFQPNPRLEGMLNSQYRGEKYQFRVNKPTATTQLKKKGGTAIFQLSGVLETAAATVEPPFRVLLFTNRPRDFENFQPVFAQPLVFEKVDQDFQFQLEKSLKLADGLYYFLIEDQESGMTYYVGKVQVQ